MRKKPSLPRLPRVDSTFSVVYDDLADVNFDDLGYVLTCHLIIESHITEIIQQKSIGIDWSETRLSFAQKLSMLKSSLQNETYDFFTPLKALNNIRNKISHDVKYRIADHDLEPFRSIVTKSEKQRNKLRSNRETFEAFLVVFCAWAAGYLNGWISLLGQLREQSESD
ncbi:MAG: hypothetical protein EOP06_16730 [Proteobacteria bacterium]|nr:MAG: hypothetical protein EOP06_16730 [Pseudomonadota bacterium]